MEDKRTTERQDISDILYISSENGIFKGNLMNISSSGMRFSLAQKLNKKEVIDININYDPVNFIQKAFIIWSKKNEEKDKYEYGAEFINMNPTHKMLMEDYLKQIILAKEKKAEFKNNETDNNIDVR